MAKVKGKQSIDEAHCLKRLKERFEVGMNHDEYRRLVNCLKSPGAKSYADIQYKFLGRESNTRSLYKMTYKGIEFHAIYNRSSKSIITVLFTPEEVERLGMGFGGTDETEQEE